MAAEHLPHVRRSTCPILPVATQRNPCRIDICPQTAAPPAGRYGASGPIGISICLCGSASISALFSASAHLSPRPPGGRVRNSDRGKLEASPAPADRNKPRGSRIAIFTTRVSIFGYSCPPSTFPVATNSHVPNRKDARKRRYPPGPR